MEMGPRKDTKRGGENRRETNGRIETEICINCDRRDNAGITLQIDLLLSFLSSHKTILIVCTQQNQPFIIVVRNDTYP